MCDLPPFCSSRIDQLIEILGFSSKQIQEYIDLMIKDGVPTELREYINSNPRISSAMYNPVAVADELYNYSQCTLVITLKHACEPTQINGASQFLMNFSSADW